MLLYCDNQVVVYIVEHHVFYERIKHIEVNFYLVRQKIEEKIVQDRHVLSGH